MKAFSDRIDSSSNTDVTETDSVKTVTELPEPVVFRKVPDSAVNRYKRDKDFAYANDPAYWEKEKENNNEDDGGWFWRLITSKGARIFVYVLIAAVLIFALYKIVIDNKLYLFYSKPKKLGKVASKEDEDLSIENIDDRIKEALLLKDNRLAIRYMFLKTLRMLSEKELIRFHSQGTNHEYALQLAGSKFGKDFQYLTKVYEYVWYGEFAVTDQQGELVQRNFNQFYNSIQN